MPRTTRRMHACSNGSAWHANPRGALVRPKFDFSRCLANHNETWDASPGKHPDRPPGGLLSPIKYLIIFQLKVRFFENSGPLTVKNSYPLVSFSEWYHLYTCKVLIVRYFNGNENQSNYTFPIKAQSTLVLAECWGSGAASLPFSCLRFVNILKYLF